MNKDDLVKIECLIVDAEYKEYLENDNAEEAYDNSIVLSLQDVKSGRQFHSALTEYNIRSIIGISRSLTSREMIDFAAKLRERTSPLLLEVNPDFNEVTPQMITASDVEPDEVLRPAPRRKSGSNSPKPTNNNASRFAVNKTERPNSRRKKDNE